LSCEVHKKHMECLQDAAGYIPKAIPMVNCSDINYFNMLHIIKLNGKIFTGRVGCLCMKKTV
jgi:hypothetical protein